MEVTFLEAAKPRASRIDPPPEVELDAAHEQLNDLFYHRQDKCEMGPPLCSECRRFLAAWGALMSVWKAKHD